MRAAGSGSYTLTGPLDPLYANLFTLNYLYAAGNENPVVISR